MKKMANVGLATDRADADSDIVASIKELLCAQGHPEGRLISSSDGRSYRWEILGGLARPCLTAQIWRPAQPEHKSNGARISVDSAGRVFLKCLHTQCRSVSGGQRCYVGTIPSSLLPHPVAPIPTNGGQTQRAARKRAVPHATAEPSLLCHTACSRQDTGPPATPGWIIGETVSPTRPADPDSLKIGTDEERASIRPQSDDQASPPVPGRPPSHLNLSRGSSMLRVSAENQSEAPDAFLPWHVVAGPYGGRLGNDELGIEAGNPVDPPHNPIKISAEEISTWCNTPPFSEPAPASLVAAVGDALDENNNNHVESQRDNQQDWEAASVPATTATPPGVPPPGSEATWTVVPEEEWFDSPTSRRPAVGNTLMRSAQELLAGKEKVGDNGATTVVEGPWADPLVISYLNIGFRRLERSLHGIAHFVLHHRPDVLFLGDLGVARNKVGRLKLMLERDLGDEWFMLTDISAPRKNQRSTGMAAVIHCSLARHITTVELVCLEGIEKEEWSKTVTGRIMQLQLSRVGCPHTWQLVGLYQYVAASKHSQSHLGT